ncbi:structural constituent of ribosome [Raphanus sativus]|uniref:Plant UBX domain-containing protein 14 n=1 Tax=Raphanus sativus TaxID=3726 RepID=A0A6J0NAI8_RAPSA|nr:putative plant UBX domain-containing protein 14 [Raphanus sativus]KAJ4904522.1 structural constituent of ribosome [Raphanus sativus]
METKTTSDQQKLISSFIEMDGGQTEETAIEFLEASNWNVEEAMHLFRIHIYIHEQLENDYPKHIPLIPLPLIRDALSPVYQAPVDVSPKEVCYSKPEPSDSTYVVGSDSTRLPPSKLLFKGSFEEAKSTSSRKDLWLLVNLQSTTKFASHTLNRDLWSNSVVSKAIESNFILLQVYDDTMEGKKICTFYKIESAPPVVLLIDPITGLQMRSWSGVIDAHSFVEDLMKYMDSGPHEQIASLTSNKRMKTEKICFESNKTSDDHIVAPSRGEKYEEVKEEETCLEFPTMIEEPKGDC